MLSYFHFQPKLPTPPDLLLPLVVTVVVAAALLPYLTTEVWPPSPSRFSPVIQISYASRRLSSVTS